MDGQRPGAAYFFEETGGVWTQHHVFSITNTYIFIDYFGRDVALRGDQALIGASSVSTDGRGFLYRRSGDDWVETAQLDDPIHTSFGRQVALGADWMAGMSFGEVPSSAIMLYKNGATSVRRQIRYTAMRSASGYWGYHEDMAIDGQELIVGRYDTHGFTNQGFGTTVAIAGDYLAIGVPGANEPTFDEGAILMQERTDTNWAFHSKLTQTGAEFGDQFGTLVDMTTNYLISGAAWADTLEGRACDKRRASTSFSPTWAV